MIETKVVGIRELVNRLESYGAAIKLEGVDKANAKAAGTIARTARKEVPVKTGQLKRSITTTRTSKKGESITERYVYCKKKKGHKKKGLPADGWYAHMVEFGTTSKGIIRARRKKVMTIPTGSRSRRDMVLRKEYEHAGRKADPFMRRAFGMSNDKAMKDMAKTLTTFIEKVGQKYGPVRR